MFKFSDKALAALAYILWIPSLYIVLTEKRRQEFVGFHGGQALIMWSAIYVIFFAVRFLVNLVWSYYYLPFLNLLEVLTGALFYGYALYCGYRCFLGQSFKLPN